MRDNHMRDEKTEKHMSKFAYGRATQEKSGGSEGERERRREKEEEEEKKKKKKKKKERRKGNIFQITYFGEEIISIPDAIQRKDVIPHSPPKLEQRERMQGEQGWKRETFFIGKPGSIYIDICERSSP